MTDRNRNKHRNKVTEESVFQNNQPFWRGAVGGCLLLREYIEPVFGPFAMPGNLYYAFVSMSSIVLF